MQQNKTRAGYVVVAIDDSTMDVLNNRRKSSESLSDAFRRQVRDGAVIESVSPSGTVHSIGRISGVQKGFKVWDSTPLMGALCQIRRPGEGLSSTAKRAIMAAARTI